MATAKAVGRKDAGKPKGGAEPPQVQLIPLKRLRESSENPRSHWGDLDGLAASIKELGVLQPIIVRPIDGAQGQPLNKGPDLEIVAGARRFRAAGMAGLAAVPAIVQDLTDLQVTPRRIAENDQRNDFHPLDQAQLYHDAIDKGFTVASLAEDTGLSESYIVRRLQLLKLIGPIRTMYLAGRIGFGQAELIARLQEADQRDLISKRGLLPESGESAPTVAELRRCIEMQFMQDLNAAAWPKDDIDLVIMAGACTTCHKRTGYQPALWPEISARDVCTDRACYRGKTAAWATRRQEETRGGARPAVKISQGYGGRSTPADVLPQQHWTEITEQQAKALPAGEVRTGIMVDGPQPGQEVLVHVPKDTTRLRDKPPAQKDDQAATDNDEDARKAAQQTAVNRAVFLQIAGRPLGLRASDWCEIATGLWDLLSVEACQLVCEVYGWTYQAEDGWNPFDQINAEWLKRHKGVSPGYEKLCRLLLLAESVTTHRPEAKIPLQLLQAAEGLGIDVAAAKKQAVAQFKAGQKDGVK